MNAASVMSTLSTSDPSIPPKDGRCVFFSLPRELRDIIYEYALTEQWGLASHKSGSNSKFVTARGPPSGSGRTMIKFWTVDRRAESTDKESNQLAYTSRQLSWETSRLGLRFNDLTFYATQTMSVLQHFDTFIQNCSIAQKNYIKKVTIIPDGSSCPGRVVGTSQAAKSLEILTGDGFAAPLYNFCLNHPNTQVVVRFHWHLYADKWINRTAALYLQCRGTLTGTVQDTDREMEGSLPLMLTADDEDTIRGVARVAAIKAAFEEDKTGTRPRKATLDNLRMSMSPMLDEPALKSNDYATHGHLPISNEEWINQVRKMWQDGV